MQLYGVVWSEGKAKTDVPGIHRVTQLNIPKLGTVMCRISSGFMNCIHKTRCGKWNGCLPFINASLKWLRLHWRFLHHALSFNLKQGLYTFERRASVALSSLKSSLQIRFIPCSNTIDAGYTTPERRFKACTQTLKTLDLAVVNFELHPSSLYPQAWFWHSNQVTVDSWRVHPLKQLWALASGICKIPTILTSLILAFQPSYSWQLKSPPTQATLSIGIWHVQNPHNPCPVIEPVIQSSQRDELHLWAPLVSHQGLWKMWYAVGSGHSTTCSTQKRLQTRTCHSFEHINLHRDRHHVLTGDRGYSLRFSSNLKTKQARYSPRKGGLIQSSTVPHCSGTTQHSLCTTCARHWVGHFPFSSNNLKPLETSRELLMPSVLEYPALIEPHMSSLG